MMVWRRVLGWVAVAGLMAGCLGVAGPQDDISESVLPPMAEAAADAGPVAGAEATAPGGPEAETLEALRGDEDGALARSEPGADGPSPTEPAPAETAPGESALDAPGAAPAANPALAAAQRACAAQGGTLSPVGTRAAGRMVCLFRTRDAGQRCTARGDCEGECLARSNTCAPVRPLFGCHEIRNAQGARVSECLE